MKTTDRINKIVWQEISDEERISLVQAIDSASELYLLIEYFNWDDGYQIPTLIAEHPLCELGTALSMFWLCDAIAWYGSPDKPSIYEEEDYQFCQFLIKKILDNTYSVREISYEVGLNKIGKKRMEKRSVPPVFWTSINAQA